MILRLLKLNLGLVLFGVQQMPAGRSAILAYTMPGFATSSRTKNQAWQLMRAAGATDGGTSWTQGNRQTFVRRRS